ncbi:uncharacterized protein BO97DRAFT_430996 [Aspergillus homomorphus CBS 101889]|uniref:Single-strand DNA deaminase toxin A-like C-terminal domain-containing protein n=1 Tax=Aspergillus homomorphus (strain CBS 101889) TaxID=1450537 RepID=A0A395I9R0_ASPHC|nr:hypothetical protein BO97DRAFT_430996 [Aspergillus homomorphus CBS 101889]RAL16962.1 hypothetical protein BO97DRAFT_430996 [Aspergillus homomorphus CBS 101889]
MVSSRFFRLPNEEDYICCFPFTDQGQVTYDIDKKRAWFVNICAVANGEKDTIESLAEKFDAKVNLKVDHEANRASNYPKIDEVSKELLTFKLDLGDGAESFQTKRIVLAVSQCVDGLTEAVETYLNSCTEAQILLHGRDREANTTLILAIMEQSSAMVSPLLRHGAKIDATNVYGRSALMEAALWGRLDNDTEKNRRERYVRAGGVLSATTEQKPVYREDTFNRDKDRQAIVRLIGEDRKSNITYESLPTASEYVKYTFQRTLLRDSIEFKGPSAKYPITNPKKTVARLERGGRCPSVAAISGWSHASERNPNVRVKGKRWTADVLYIASLVGHKLPPHEYDQDISGAFSACHAEKQLIAHLIDRHVSLACDTISVPELEEKLDSHRKIKTDLFHPEDTYLGHKKDEARISRSKSELASVNNKLEKLESNHEVGQIISLENRLGGLNQNRAKHQALIDLSNARPPHSLKIAAVLVSFPICRDCEEFAIKVNQYFGLSMQVAAV